MSSIMTEKWKDPEFIAKQKKSRSENHNHHTKEWKEHHSQVMTEKWKDPEFRAKHKKI